MGAKEVKVTLWDSPLRPGSISYISKKMYEYMSKEAVKGHPLAPFLSQEGLYSFIQELNEAGKLNVYIYNDEIVGILGYDVGVIPGSTYKVLKELTMFTIDPNFCGFGRIAVERLEELAVEHDCSLIETGDSINFDQTMTRNIYMKKGNFTASYQCYYKVIVPHSKS